MYDDDGPTTHADRVALKIILICAFITSGVITALMVAALYFLISLY
nr:MAG TPA: hypothetical protein [Bacteriophage sp.]